MRFNLHYKTTNGTRASVEIEAANPVHAALVLIEEHGDVRPRTLIVIEAPSGAQVRIPCPDADRPAKAPKLLAIEGGKAEPKPRKRRRPRRKPQSDAAAAEQPCARSFLPPTDDATQAELDAFLDSLVPTRRAR